MEKVSRSFLFFATCSTRFRSVFQPTSLHPHKIMAKGSGNMRGKRGANSITAIELPNTFFMIVASVDLTTEGRGTLN